MSLFIHIYVLVCVCVANNYVLSLILPNPSLEMLDKSEVPVIADGYPLVVAMNALLNAIKSVSLVINDKMPPSPHSSPPPDSQIPALTPGTKELQC